jgi:branched-chain amino acid transport system substrate-binding protein
MGLAACAGCSGQTPPAPLFLGHIATLSGADARAGKSAEQGIRFALQELGPAASENLAGRPLVVRHVDAAGSLDNLEGQAARLVSVNRVVGLLGGLTKEEALRLDRSRVPVLSAAGMRTSAMSDLLFTTGLAPSTQGRVLAEFLVEEAPAAGTLIVDPRREEALACAEHFRRTWEELWQKKDAKARPPHWVELTLPKDVKLGEWATVPVKDKPKAVVFAGNAADFEELRKAWGASVPLLVFAGDDGSWSPSDAVAGQTIYLATVFAAGKETAKVHEFVKSYRASNREDPDVHAAIAYDNLRIFVEALKKSQSEKADKLREELHKIQDFAGVAGPLTFTREQHLRRPVFIARVEGPSRVPTAVKTYAP